MAMSKQLLNIITVWMKSIFLKTEKEHKQLNQWNIVCESFA